MLELFQYLTFVSDDENGGILREVVNEYNEISPSPLLTQLPLVLPRRYALGPEFVCKMISRT